MLQSTIQTYTIQQSMKTAINNPEIHQSTIQSIINQQSTETTINISSSNRDVNSSSNLDCNYHAQLLLLKAEVTQLLSCSSPSGNSQVQQINNNSAPPQPVPQQQPSKPETPKMRGSSSSSLTDVLRQEVEARKFFKPMPLSKQLAQQKAIHNLRSKKLVIVDDAANKSTDACESSDDNPTEGGDKLKRFVFKKLFLTRRKSSVRQKARKIRQNRLLRKSLSPKNALMALHEIKGMAIGEFMIAKNTEGGFTATVHIENKEYIGKGTSKINAKNDACEQALRDYLLDKLNKHPRFSKQKKNANGVVPMDTSEPETQNSADGDTATGTANEDKDEEEDDVPMLNLASYAIYKLFVEWEKQGYKIPDLHPMSAVQASTESKKSTMRTHLPPNWETMHPATLLCLMRPGLTYTDNGQVGDKPPNMLQSFSVFVDENEFIGTGRSKKQARRNAAVMACNTLFGTTFEREDI